MNKTKLTKAATDQGIDVPSSWNMEQIQKAIDEKNGTPPQEGAAPPQQDPAAVAAAEAEERLAATRARAAALSIDGSGTMDLAALEVAIEEATETKLRIRVKKAVTTAKGINFEAREYELPAHELAASGLEPRHYERLDADATT